MDLNSASLPVVISGAEKVGALAELPGMSFLRVFHHPALTNSIYTQPIIAAHRAVWVRATPPVIRQSGFRVRLAPSPNIRSAAPALATLQGSSAVALGAVVLFVLGAVTLTLGGRRRALTP